MTVTDLIHSTQFDLLLTVLGICFLIPILRWIYYLYKDRIEKHVQKGLTGITERLKNTMDGKSRKKQKKKKKKKAGGAAKTEVPTSVA